MPPKKIRFARGTKPAAAAATTPKKRGRKAKKNLGTQEEATPEYTRAALNLLPRAIELAKGLAEDRPGDMKAAQLADLLKCMKTAADSGRATPSHSQDSLLGCYQDDVESPSLTLTAREEEEAEEAKELLVKKLWKRAKLKKAGLTPSSCLPVIDSFLRTLVQLLEQIIGVKSRPARIDEDTGTLRGELVHLGSSAYRQTMKDHAACIDGMTAYKIFESGAGVWKAVVQLPYPKAKALLRGGYVVEEERFMPSSPHQGPITFIMEECKGLRLHNFPPIISSNERAMRCLVVLFDARQLRGPGEAVHLIFDSDVEAETMGVVFHREELFGSVVACSSFSFDSSE